jgi:hypothetical protein
VWKKIKEEAKRGEGLWDTSEMWDHNWVMTWGYTTEGNKAESNDMRVHN